MSGLLQVTGRNNRNKVSHMQAVRRGVNAQIKGHGFFFKGFVQVLFKGDLSQKTAFLQDVQNMLHGVFFLSVAFLLPFDWLH